MSAGRNIWAVMTRTAVYVFDKYHFTINAFSGSAIMSVGDIAQQNVERYHGLSEGYDWSRTGKYILYIRSETMVNIWDGGGLAI